MSSRTKRIAAVAGITVLLVATAYGIVLGTPKHDYFIERVGTIVEQAHAVEDLPDRRLESVRLVSSTGLEVDMRVLRPLAEAGATYPLLLVLGGQETGKNAVDLVGDPRGIAYAAIDYPYRGDQDLDSFWESATAIPHVQRAFLDTPPAVSLALNWLLDQPWVDSERAELAGISLGVPFAAPAGALDKRFRRVWLLHGGGDNVSWVSHNARRHIDNDFLRNIVSRTTLFLVYGNSFDTRRWIPKIAPRPLIIVMARDDDFVPKESQEPMIEAAASEHVELIWTEGRHIGPRRENELGQLLDIVRSRIASQEQ